MKKILSIILCLALVLSLAAVVSADETMHVVAEGSNTADFAALKDSTLAMADTTYGARTSADGWSTVGTAALAKDFMNGATAAVLNGRTSNVGKLTSGTLTGPLKSLSFNYGFPFGDDQFSLTISVKQGDTVVASTTVEKTGLTKETAYEYVWNLDTAVEGEYTLEFVNNCLSNVDKNKDRLAIWNLTWSATAGEAPEEPEVPEDPEVPENNDPAADSTLTIPEANTLGASKEHNTYTEGKYYVTGVISEIANTTYGNLYIQDAEGNTLYVYGLYTADGSVRFDKMETQPAVGDTITVYGIIGQYNSNPQMKNGWMTAHTAGSTTPEEPEVPETNDPAADSTLTIEEALALGASKEHNVYTEGKYYVTGVITEVYNTTYGNMKITDEAGNILTIYGTYNADGTVRYDKMETQPVAGDTVTIYGIVGQYNSTPQVKNGWIVAHTPAATPDPDPEPTPDPEPETPVEPEEPETVIKLVKVENPTTGVAFKMGYYQANLEKTLYFAGAMDGYYYATTEDEDAAVDVYVEVVDGGYHLYFMDGETKTYLDIIAREGTTDKVNVVLTTTPTAVFTWNSDACTFVVKDLQGGDWYMGTYGTYSTISASLTSYIEDLTTIGVSQFPAFLYQEKEVPATGDAISVIFALMAVSAVGAAVIIKKKEF